jgi:DNA mismatch endonuclease, patch repair protein
MTSDRVTPSPHVRRKMQSQRRKDTALEIAVRRSLHAAGVRYRVDVRPEPDLRTRGDIVWRGLKVVVFLDGCFWHGCPEHGTSPKRNSAWWAEKLESNVRRDRRADELLQERGWHVLRFWEHEDPTYIVERVIAELNARR